MKDSEDINGILVVDKPSGWTSHDVVKKTKRLLDAKKVGHTGTLDPMATGVLVLLVGHATKLAYRFEHDRKRYLAGITFGSSTDTYDAEGVVTATGDPSVVDTNDLKRVVDHMKGEIQQIPPMFSAVKVGGKRLYKLAREGRTIERKARTIIIDSISADYSAYPVVLLDIICSKGTYVRSVAHHLGESLGCPAHLSTLRRIASGNYTIESAVDFKAIVESGATDKLEMSILQPEILE